MSCDFPKLQLCRQSTAVTGTNSSPRPGSFGGVKFMWWGRGRVGSEGRAGLEQFFFLGGDGVR